MLQRMEEENYTPEPFAKYSEAALLVFGYSDETHDYFIEKYNDIEKFNERVLAIKRKQVTYEEIEYYDNLERSEDMRRNLLRDSVDKGLAKGKAEGERLKTCEIVLKMHSKHLSAETIAEMVGLNAFEVAAIIADGTGQILK
jgi:predicted transposase YdaD